MRNPELEPVDDETPAKITHEDILVLVDSKSIPGHHAADRPKDSSKESAHHS
jgi:hypothetical protein